MNDYKSLFYLILLILCTSCAFNGRFHRSEKIALPFEKISFYNRGADTTYLDYNEQTRAINLLNSKKESLHEAYSIVNDFFVSSSGNKLQIWTLTPKNQKPIANILHFHGSGTNLLSQYQSIAPLVELGYQVFTFDYSGYGVSEGKSTVKNALKDAYSALDYVSELKNVKNKSLIIYGQSYGGYLAAIVGANRQDKIEGIVIEGAFYAHKEEAKVSSPFFGNLVKNDLIATEEIQKNHQPVLVIHSNEDKVVPFEFGKKIYESANEPKAFFEIDKGHVMGLQYRAAEISDKMIDLMLE